MKTTARLAVIVAIATGLSVAIPGVAGAASPDPTQPAPQPCIRTVSIHSVTAFEGTGSRTTRFPFTVVSSGCGAAGTLTFLVNSGTASIFSDLVAVNGSITFGLGDLSNQTAAVAVVADSSPEPTETFGVRLCSDSADIVIANSTATGTITNDDFVGATLIDDNTEPEVHCAR